MTYSWIIESHYTVFHKTEEHWIILDNLFNEYLEISRCCHVVIIWQTDDYIKYLGVSLDQKEYYWNTCDTS